MSFPSIIGTETELVSCFQSVSPLSALSKKILLPEEKTNLSSLITISDEVKKSVASAYCESAVFLDQIISPVFALILYISAEDVIANRSPSLVKAKDNKLSDLIKDPIDRKFQIKDPSFAFKQKILLS